MFIQVVYLKFACQCHVACECYNLNSRGADKECHVKAYLVVAGTCGAVCDCVGSDFVCVSCYGKCLEYSLRGY